MLCAFSVTPQPLNSKSTTRAMSHPFIYFLNSILIIFWPASMTFQFLHIIYPQHITHNLEFWRRTIETNLRTAGCPPEQNKKWINSLAAPLSLFPVAVLFEAEVSTSMKLSFTSGRSTMGSSPSAKSWPSPIASP